MQAVNFEARKVFVHMAGPITACSAMKSLETTLPISAEAPATERARSSEAEKPVFAATSDARPRALKLFGKVAAGLVALWLVALVLGAFGLGQIAGIKLPQIGGGDSRRAERSEPVVREHRAQAPTPASAAASRVLPGHRLSSQPAGSGHHGPGARTGGGSSSGSRTNGGSGSGGSTRAGGGNAGSGSATPLSTPTRPAPSNSGSSQGTTAPSSSPSPQASPNATPPGSSSSDPGSRSQAGTAPGRDNSTASPTPGSGSSTTEHGRPTG